MFGKVEKAIADWPKMKPINGGNGVHVTGKYMPPGMIKTAQGIYLIGAAAGTFYAMDQASKDNILIAGGIAIAFFVAAYKLYWMNLITPILGKSVDVKILPDSIQVAQMFGYKTYPRSRDVSFEFSVDRHQKALKEEAREIETNKKQPKTYRQAVEAVMQYGEKRVVIAEFNNKEMEKARALVFRLGSLNDAARKNQEPTQESVSQKMSQYISTSATVGDFGRAPDIR